MIAIFGFDGERIVTERVYWDRQTIAAQLRGKQRLTLRGDTLGGMCRRVNCKTCDKPNWAGCGSHVERVLAEVPKQDRCRCRELGTRAAGTPASAPTDTTLAKFRGWRKK